MDLIKYALSKPISVAVAVILIIMFGLIGLNKLPVQLTPDIELPEITVKTTWPGASPYEVEQDIIDKQEEKLKGLQNLIKMESSSYNNYGEISLTFKVGTDLDNALLRVSNKLNEVSDYPDNADNPAIEAAGAQSSPVVWMMLKVKDKPSAAINKYKTFFENEIRQQLERIEGVGSLFVGGGTEDELHLVLDADKMARHNITIGETIDKIQGANANHSAGTLGIGKKDYRIRTVSKFQQPDDALDVVLYDDGIKRIFFRNIGYAEKGYEKATVSVIQNADDVIVIGVRKEQGANVIQLVNRLKAVVEELNKGILAENQLYIDWVYDQAPYINTAIELVQQNVLIGGLLAIAVLLIFLRSISATITTAIAIPISVIGTFIFLWILNRNFNVVSLAGISFAVGMLVDNSIVVLENIDRHRGMGKSPMKACYEGATEVLGAVLASTITTVAVFAPIIFIQEEAGQLFRDIAIAITFSIIISLFVSIAVIPTVLNQFYKRLPAGNKQARRLGVKRLFKGPLNLIGTIGQMFSGAIMNLSGFFLRNTFTRLVSIIVFTAISISLIVWLIPKAEYLPQGNRNLILNILVPPPGNSLEKRKAIGDYIYRETDPYFKEDYKDGIPQIKDLFYVATPELNLFGGLTIHETEARKMMPLFNRIMNSIPDMFGVSIQSGIFQSDIGGGRSIDVNISGTDLHEIINAARMLYGGIKGAIGTAQIRPVPSLEISYPEVTVIPDKKKLAANGLTESEVGIYIDVLMDGRQIGDYQPEGVKQIDLVIKGADETYTTPEDILESSIVNAYGDLIRIGDVVELRYTTGMNQVDHLERKRTIRLEVTPPSDLPLQAAMDIIEKDIIKALKSKGQLETVTVSVGGNADKLTATRQALQWNFLLAIAITYLLMAALFENFFYPFIILFTIPLAGAGGFIGLRLVNAFVAPQAFDVLTMLGFIILVGTVVNNAILIVHQSLNNVRYEGMRGIAAITESVRTRIRPIFMSASTSVFGLLPLVISTGSGSELYRGLGSVLLGGLVLSTVFTLFVIPSLLAFFIGFEGKKDETFA
jgi:HAE1 family hydrophobic/amphiphilic exporter-1